jgi:photosystem II stability/assembly factor-like uncharacterized protein
LANLRKIPYLCLFLSVVLDLTSPGFCDGGWEQVSGIYETGLKSVFPDPCDKGTIYVSGEKTLYRTHDGGVTWQAVFFVRPAGGNINFIYASPQGVFACSEDGLFASQDGMSDWKGIFKGVGDKEGNARHITLLEDKRLYLATDSGLFISSDNGNTWVRDDIGGPGLGVRWLEFFEDVFIAATAGGVYKNSGEGWKRTFVTAREETEHDVDAADENSRIIKPVNSITLARGNIFLAADSGVFFSEDKGESWKEFTGAGAASLKIRKLAYKDKLYAATDKGVFMFLERERTWKPLYNGMPATDVRDISIGADGYLWAATNRGLYKYKTSVGSGPRSEYHCLDPEINRIMESFKDEPGINEVQKAAIEYAEVHPDKIREWRSAAGKKALLPDVSVGIDRYVTDYWHWDSGTNPDTLQKGRDAVCWDVTMTWDMGEFIWNSDQTSIDTRSKLMVELRDDILNEITRVYFERRRLQIEMFVSPAGDLKLSLEKELRLQELTADIDALTGNYFSEHLPHDY